MSPPPIRATYSLTDHNGTPVTERTYCGRWQLVQFGFTSCRVVCPRALTKLSRALDELEHVAGPAPLVPLYVTVDPDRDHPAVMKAFLEASYPRFTGLTGTVRQTEDAKEAFKVFTRRRKTPDGYDVAHTAMTYLLDPGGRPAHYWSDQQSADTITRHLAQWLGPWS